MYNREEEKAFVLSLVQSMAQDNMKFTKQQNFERAIAFANDELAEFKMHFDRFVADVSHLEVFQHSFKEPLTHDVEKLLQSVHYLVSKNYTQAEKEAMPQEVITQVLATQERRFDLLGKIARRYLARPKKD